MSFSAPSPGQICVLGAGSSVLEFGALSHVLLLKFSNFSFYEKYIHQKYSPAVSQDPSVGTYFLESYLYQNPPSKAQNSQAHLSTLQAPHGWEPVLPSSSPHSMQSDILCGQ